MHDDWTRLRQEWQGSAPGEAALRVRRRTPRLVFAIAAEWLASAIVLAFWSWVIARDPHPTNIAMAVFSAAFVVVWLALLHRNLRASLAPLSGSVKATLALGVERARAQSRWTRVVHRSCLVLGAFVVPWGLSMLWAHWDVYAAEPWRAVVGFGGIYAILAVVWVISSASRRAGEKEARELERLLHALELTD